MQKQASNRLSKILTHQPRLFTHHLKKQDLLSLSSQPRPPLFPWLLERDPHDELPHPPRAWTPSDPTSCCMQGTLRITPCRHHSASRHIYRNAIYQFRHRIGWNHTHPKHKQAIFQTRKVYKLYLELLKGTYYSLKGPFLLQRLQFHPSRYSGSLRNFAHWFDARKAAAYCPIRFVLPTCVCRRYRLASS